MLRRAYPIDASAFPFGLEDGDSHQLASVVVGDQAAFYVIVRPTLRFSQADIHYVRFLSIVAPEVFGSQVRLWRTGSLAARVGCATSLHWSKVVGYTTKSCPCFRLTDQYRFYFTSRWPEGFMLFHQVGYYRECCNEQAVQARRLLGLRLLARG